MWRGYRGGGGIFALPLACFAALVLVRMWLRPEFDEAGDVVARRVSWNYSAHIVLGLAVFGMLVNLDALFVKRFFSPAIAGNYGPVVTLSKVCLFFPLAMGIILLPKAKLRQATGRDARPVFLMALAGVLLPGFILSSL